MGHVVTTPVHIPLLTWRDKAGPPAADDLGGCSTLLLARPGGSRRADEGNSTRDPGGAREDLGCAPSPQVGSSNCWLLSPGAGSEDQDLNLSTSTPSWSSARSGWGSPCAGNMQVGTLETFAVSLSGSTGGDAQDSISGSISRFRARYKTSHSNPVQAQGNEVEAQAQDPSKHGVA